MSFFKSVFKLISAFCFFIVFIQIIAICYFYNYPEHLVDILKPTHPTEIMDQAENDVSINLMSVRKNENRNLRPVPEYENNDFNRIKIESKEGMEFRRASQIVSVESGKPTHLVTTVSEDAFHVHHKKHSLSELYEILSNKDCFYKMKGAIINCRYVQRIIKNTPSKKVIMENGVEINLPNDHVNSLETRIESVNLD